ncbi:MAG: metalloregulator ArsR/SmtB family transcription factor [Melioribacteraceae bacterium]|nr:metalloregulator ArsR/SmtB family transcription factor [Melioribacteraceae bacterium]
MTKKTEKLKALADETRLRILNLFIRSGNSLCVCELVDTLKLPQYHISKHLIVLRNAGYFQQVREGTWVYYELDNSQSENKKIFSFLKKLLDDEIFEKDFEQLNRRLILREDNKCVVGFVDESELLKLIKQKEKV